LRVSVFFRHHSHRRPYITALPKHENYGTRARKEHGTKRRKELGLVV